MKDSEPSEDSSIQVQNLKARIARFSHTEDESFLSILRLAKRAAEARPVTFNPRT